MAPPSYAHAHAYMPEGYRMSLGEHLEELRKRILQGLLGFIAAGVVCGSIQGRRSRQRTPS